MSDSQRFATALSRLSATIAERQGDDPSQSYTAKLLSQGTVKAAQKLGE